MTAQDERVNNLGTSPAVGGKEPRTYFYTTSLEKYAQAQAVFELWGLSLYQISRRAGPREYDEDYSHGKRNLLVEALKQIRQRHGESSLVFVEDTSLRIDSFSSEDDWPGLRVKEWFQDTTFEEVDEQLRKRGDQSRKATVKSDIALHIPGLEWDVLFYGECTGRIAATPPDFEPNPVYPWLTPHTFNGWLIPDGANQRLGEMSLKESLDYDFRAKALTSLAVRLTEYRAILNVPSPGRAYRRVPARRQGHSVELFDRMSRSFVVIGYPCAGKTTFGQYVSKNYLALGFEASNILQGQLRFEVDHPGVESDPLSYAQTVLGALGKDVVARHFVDEMLPEASGEHVVVTGFRTLEELVTIKSALPDVCVVFIDAGERTRLLRQMDDSARESMTAGEFRARDHDQGLFGLLPVARDVADVIVENEYDLELYERQIDSIVSLNGGRSVSGVHQKSPVSNDLGSNQLYKCLASLRSAGRPLSTDEIETQSVQFGQRVRHNNANKVLKLYPALARRHELRGARIRYAITGSGLSYLKLLELQAEGFGPER